MAENKNSQKDVLQKIDRANEHLKNIDLYFNLNPRSLARNFVFGLFTALGATVGLAVTLAILGLIIKLAGGIPGIGQWFVQLGMFLDKK